MDINKIDYFFAAAELKNFTQAAEKCNIAQTTMSKYIVSLESEIGISLFHRTNKGCSLTEQGQIFYSGMKKLYEEYSDLNSNILIDQKAELRIGIGGEFSKLAPLQAFENAYRNIKISISFGSKNELFDALRRQRIHAVILPYLLQPSYITDSGFVSVDLISEKGLLTFSPVANDRYAAIEDIIENLPFISKSSDHVYHDYCREALFKQYGARFKNVQVVDSCSKQQLLVSLSQGFAIIPASEITSSVDLMQRFIGDEFNETLQLVYNKNHQTAYMKEFIRFIKSQELQ